MVEGSSPTFADISCDGVLDAFVGQYYGTVKYYRDTEIDAGANAGFVAEVLVFTYMLIGKMPKE